MTTISASISFDDDGVRYGCLRVPHSVHDSAYGHIPIPLAVAKRGSGPTVLLTGGVHGDEYEGPIALYSLMRQLEQMPLSGRLIIIPSINQPAFLAGARVSPIDNLNMNRCFPGSSSGSVTQMIANYVASELIPLASYAFDMHSGGSSLQYLPILLAPQWHDGTKRGAIVGLVEAFSPTLVAYFDSLKAVDGDDRVFGKVANKYGCHFLTGEFGGGSSVNLDGLAMLKSGLGRVLHHVGLIGEPSDSARPTSSTRHLSLQDPGLFAFSPVNGIFEPSYRLGDELPANSVAGWIYDPVAPWNPPMEVRFKSGGLAVCIRTFARVKPGDCLGHLAKDI